MAVRVAESGGAGKVLVHDPDPVLNNSLGIHSAPESRYEGTALWVGRSSGVAEALAVDANGKPAIIARVTAYR